MIKDDVKKETEEVVEEEVKKEQKSLQEEIDEEIKKNEAVNEKPAENIQNIDLSVFNKKKFSINGDPDKIIELDVSDLNILSRLKEQYPVLEKLGDKVAKLGQKTDGLSNEELISVAADGLAEIDADMRNCIDVIFDYPVSKVCVPTGSMYDPINGKFRYEHLIDTLVKLYDQNLSLEVKKLQNKVAKHTNKYVKKK